MHYDGGGVDVDAGAGVGVGVAADVDALWNASLEMQSSTTYSIVCPASDNEI